MSTTAVPFANSAAATPQAAWARSLADAEAALAASEQLTRDAQQLAAGGQELLQAARPLAWAAAVDLPPLQAQLESLGRRMQEVRSRLSELASRAGWQFPVWSNETQLSNLAAELRGIFFERRAMHVRNVYLRVANDLATATVEHPSPQIKETLDRLIQDALHQLHLSADREFIPAPPTLLIDEFWWKAVLDGGAAAMETHAASLRESLPALADLLPELSRFRFANVPPASPEPMPVAVSPAVVVEPPAVTETITEPMAMETVADTPAEPTTTAEPSLNAVESTAPASDVVPATAAIRRTTQPAPLSARERVSNTSVTCPRCVSNDSEVAYSRIRVWELPLLVVRRRPYRCCLCNTRFFDWS